MSGLSIQAAFTGGRVMSDPMQGLRLLPFVMILGLMAAQASPAMAAGRGHRACLNKAEQRAAVAGHRAIRL